MSHWHMFQFDWPTVSENDDAKETQMLYKFDYLPPGLFNRAQVRDDVGWIRWPASHTLLVSSSGNLL